MFRQRGLFLAVLTAVGVAIGFSPDSAEAAHHGGFHCAHVGAFCGSYRGCGSFSHGGFYRYGAHRFYCGQRLRYGLGGPCVYGDYWPCDSNQNYFVNPAAPTDDTVHVRVMVPANAEVWFDDNPTQQRGSIREFLTPPLTPGLQSTYEIRARWREGNHDMTQTRKVSIQAGQTVTVDFIKGE